MQQFRKDSAGALAKDTYIGIPKSDTVNEAVCYVRDHVGDETKIRNLYVIGEDNVLCGVLTIHELLYAEGDKKITDIMNKDIISLPADLDQEEAANEFRKTNLTAMPVVTPDNVLIGIITLGDIINVIDLETAEDFRKMSSTGEFGPSLKNARISILYRKRIGWLIVLVFVNIFSGAGIAHFEDVIASSVALVFFLPLLIDSGGNAGSQASTMMIRAIATGDIKPADWLKMFTKELSVSLLLGLTMSVAVSAIGIWRGGPEVAVVVCITMLVIVVVGSLIGMCLPFIFKLIKMDPATSSGPLITSLCDIAGVLIYFSVASWYLQF